MRRAILLGLVLSALATASRAPAAVRLISISSPVRPTGYVTLSIRAGNAQCSPRVHYRSKPALRLDGLGPKGTLFAGIVSWRWKMPAHATRGKWAVDVSCGASGTLHTSFVVR